MLGAVLMAEHYPWFYQSLMQAMREAIAGRLFAVFAARVRQNYLGA